MIGWLIFLGGWLVGVVVGGVDRFVSADRVAKGNLVEPLLVEIGLTRLVC